MNPTKERPVFYEAVDYLRTLFSLSPDTDEAATIESVRRDIEFKGGNIWALIFAIFVASIGLNMNSTAVIVGAMLISPLMGPIVGAGLAIGINDLEMLKRSLRNLAVAVVISVLASALYFWISPLSEVQSELLARTRPTIYDVLIAIFGGATGIVAGSRKGAKGNAIPGVAIATALMPPLCTAGFGLATQNWSFFLGAFYLFTINSVFICLTTMVFVRYLKFEHKHFLDPQRERRVKKYIAAFAFITILPSIYVAWQVVNETIFTANANRFISENLDISGDHELVRSKVTYRPDTSLVEVTLFGRPLSEDLVEDLERRLPQYGLLRTKLVLNQPLSHAVSMDQLNREIKVDILEDLYKKNEEVVQKKDERIRFLERQIIQYRRSEIPVGQIARELKVQYPEVESVGYGSTLRAQASDARLDTIPTFIVKWQAAPADGRDQQLEEFLKVRLNLDRLDVINQ